MSFPTITCEIAFAGNPLDASPTWTDVSSFVRSFSVSRGRARELDRIEAGTAAIVLDNNDQRFDPENSASPYSPNIKPLKQIRLRATINSITYDLFRGYVESWPQSYNEHVDAVVELRCVDAFKLFALSRQPSSGFRDLILSMRPVAYWPMDEDATDDRFADLTDNPTDMELTGQPAQAAATGPYSNGPNAAEFDGGDDYAEAPDARKVKRAIRGSFTWVCWLNAVNIDVSSQREIVIQVDVGVLNGPRFSVDLSADAIFRPRQVGSGIEVISSNGAVPGSWNLFVMDVDVDAGVARIYRNNVLGQSKASADLTGVPPNEYTEATVRVGGPLGGAPASSFFNARIAHVAMFDRVLSAEERAALNDAAYDRLVADDTGTLLGEILDAHGWPAGQRTIDVGVSSAEIRQEESASLLELMQMLGETEDGLLFMTPDGKVRFVDRHSRFVAPGTTIQATFDDDGTDLPYHDITLEFDDEEIWNIVELSTIRGAPVRREDSTSITSYGERTLPRRTLERSRNGAVDVADGLLERYADPFLRITELVILPESTNDLWDKALGLDLEYERIRVRRNPPGSGDVIDEELFIAGIRHDVSASPRHWQTTWYLAPADEGIGQPWLLGDSTHGVLDTTTKLGY